MSLATEIKEVRAKLSLSQSQASKAWGIPLGTLKGYEKGQREPRGLAMTKLQEILNAAASTPVPASSEPPRAASPAPLPGGETTASPAKGNSLPPVKRGRKQA